MKLCFLIPSIKKLGPINVVFDLCLSLSKECEITLVSMQPRIAGNSVVEFSLAGVSDIIFISSSSFVGKYFELKEILSSGQFDIIHSHCFIPDLLNSLISSNGNKVSTLHNFLYEDYKYEYGKLKGLTLSLLHKFSLHRIKNVVGCSESVKSVTRVCDTFIRNGVTSPTSYKIVNKKIKFIYVGRLIDRKNVSLLVSAFSNFPSVELHIVGDGPLLKYLKSIAKPNIFFHGFEPEPSKFYSKVDFFVSASHAEGLPLSMLESLSFSLSYIVSDILPHREIHDLSSSGLVVKNDLQSWLSAIEHVNSLSEVEINKMKLNSSESFDRNFNSLIMADSYYGYYKQVGLKNA